MPAVLPIIFMIGLIIWSLPVSAQKAQRFGPFDWRTGHSATDDWISLWVLENFADNVDLDEVELLEPQEFSRIKRSKSAQIGQPQPTSSLADDNVKLMQQLEATSTVLAIIDTQAAKTAMEKEILAAKAEQDRQHIAALESELSKS